VTDTSKLPDGALASPSTRISGNDLALFALIEIMRFSGTIEADHARMVGIIAMSPVELRPFVDDVQYAAWSRLIGSDMRLTMTDTGMYWGYAVRYLKGTGRMIEKGGTWIGSDLPPSKQEWMRMRVEIAFPIVGSSFSRVP
jgi:hypothetical protein